MIRYSYAYDMFPFMSFKNSNGRTGMINQIDNGYTEFYLESNMLDKWLYQNKTEIIDGLDGCLLDNYLVSTNNGIALILEHATTCWSSNYHVWFARENSGYTNTIYTDWEQFAAEWNESVNA